MILLKIENNKRKSRFLKKTFKLTNLSMNIILEIYIYYFKKHKDKFLYIKPFFKNL